MSQPNLNIQDGCKVIQTLLQEFKTKESLDYLRNVYEDWVDNEKSDEATTEANNQIIELLVKVNERVMTQFGFQKSPESHETFTSQLVRFESAGNEEYNKLSNDLKDFYEEVRMLCNNNYGDDDEEEEEDECSEEEEEEEEEEIVAQAPKKQKIDDKDNIFAEDDPIISIPAEPTAITPDSVEDNLYEPVSPSTDNDNNNEEENVNQSIIIHPEEPKQGQEE